MKICCGSAHYFNKSETLVLVAYIGNTQVVTIEVSLKDYTILQCRGYVNGSCAYSKRIADIISKNTSLIEERKTAEVDHIYIEEEQSTTGLLLFFTEILKILEGDAELRLGLGYEN